MENYLTVYLEQNVTLAKTLVIKSALSAGNVNDKLISEYGADSVDLNTPTSWKYYLNLAGEYHWNNENITVTSLDTLETIIFNKANLAIHTSTAKAYEYGSRYYHNLVNAYPKEEQLILGVLYPVSLQTAVNAEDHSILSYPPDLVEPQEVTLITELEEYIKLYHKRWDIPSFGISDEYYPAAQMAVFYLSLVPKLLLLRLNRCHTNEAHTFHIREYLASHENLDTYLPYLTLKQKLFLYRNIKYIERNAGKVSTFQLLIDRLLTERRIPLSEYSIRQLSSFTDDLYPVIQIRRKALNARYNTPDKDYFDFEVMVSKEKYIAIGNEQYLDQYSSNIKRLFELSGSSVVQTNVLESSMVDYSDAIPDPLAIVLYREWGHLISAGYYNSVVHFKDPITYETKSLSTSDAFIYMHYIWLCREGFKIETLPGFLSVKHRTINKPTVSQLLSIVNKNDEMDYKAIADSLISKHPNITECKSVSAFYKLAYSIYQQCKYEWYLTSSMEDMWVRGNVENMCTRFYELEKVELPEHGMSMRMWLYSRNLPIYNYTSNEAEELVASIFKAGSGIMEDDSKSPKAIQRAMLAIFKQLSSYTLEIIQEINDGKVIPLNWAALRLGNIRTGIVNTTKATAHIELMDVNAKAGISIPIDISDERDDTVPDLQFKDKHELEIGLDADIGHANPINFVVINSGLSISNDVDIYAQIDTLTEEQKSFIKTIY